MVVFVVYRLYTCRIIAVDLLYTCHGNFLHYSRLKMLENNPRLRHLKVGQLGQVKNSAISY